MTFTGKPSLGCESCRKVHVKCDEKRPQCSRCLRLKKICNGYRHEHDIVFRHQYGKPSVKSAPKRANKNSHILESSVLWTGTTRSLFPSQDDQSICYFYERSMVTTDMWDHSRYLHMQLPALFAGSRQDSALYLAVRAISYAVWAKFRGESGDTMRISRKRYLKSISALRAAIQDPAEVKTDETLYAVLLLCGYETIAFESGTLPAWASHVDGACSLLKFRAKEYLATPFQCKMFLFIRRNAIQSHLQLSQPVDSIFNELAEAAVSFENAEDRLLSTTIKVPQLQAFANDVLSQPVWDINHHVIHRLVQAAEDVDRELAQWANEVPPGWSFSVATNINQMPNMVSSTCYVPDEIHEYSNTYVARVWNSYRASRLIIQSILLRTSSWLSSPKNRHENYDNVHVLKVNRTLVNEICATVPFLLGCDLKKWRKPSSNITIQDKPLWPQDYMCKVEKSQRTGRFSLIWPIHLACTVASIPESQASWMCAQLQWLALNGESYAKHVLEAQNQTLLGRPEPYRFDCV